MDILVVGRLILSDDSHDSFLRFPFLAARSRYVSFHILRTNHCRILHCRNVHCHSSPLHDPEPVSHYILFSDTELSVFLLSPAVLRISSHELPFFSSGRCALSERCAPSSFLSEPVFLHHQVVAPSVELQMSLPSFADSLGMHVNRSDKVQHSR